MHEWGEPIRDINELFQDPQAEQPQNGRISESLAEICQSGNYAHIVLSGEDTRLKTIEVGKIILVENSTLSSLHIIPPAVDLVKLLEKKDPASLLERTVQEAIGTYEIDQETIESVLALAKYYSLKTLFGFFGYTSSSGSEPLTEISVPICLIGATSPREAIQIGASFMKITEASDAITRVREQAFKSRLG